MTHLLTKSEYMMFLKHPAWLWLKVHDKTKLPPTDAGLQAMFDAGHAFEAYAESLFPGGIALGFTDYHSYLSLPTRTEKALTDGARTIFQGRFETGELTFICDVLTVIGDKTVDLCEIKSSAHVKEDHIYDLAFQFVVLEKCGYTVRNISIAHVNSEYVRHGSIEADKLVKFIDVTKEVKEKKDLTLVNINSALSVIQTKEHPNFSPSLCGLGSLKDWLSIYRTLVTLEPGSIYDLCRLTPDLISQLEAGGITNILDIPVNIPLNKFQARQVQAVRTNQVHAEIDVIASILGDYQYPLYFLDYETFSSGVPDFDGLHPYDQIPFQYSLHVIDSPGSPVRHFEYLHDTNSNPALELSKSLRSHIGDVGSIVTWYSTFEKGCNKRLGNLLPEYSEFFSQVNARIVDLMDPFMNGMYVHKDFLGKSSIKNVLPILLPELSYKDLNIHEGNSAQRLWMEAVLHSLPSTNKAKVLADLHKYCELDTLAMVRIYEFLKT